MFYKNLKVTETSVKSVDSLVSPNNSYNSGDRSSIITASLSGSTIRSGSIATLFDGNITNSMEIDTSPFTLDIEFVEKQNIDMVKVYVSNYNEITPDFYVSEDGVKWLFRGTFPTWNNSNDETPSPLALDLGNAYKYFRIVVNTSLIRGKIYEIEFNTVSYTKTTSVSADGLATGQMDFEHSFLTDVDGSGNKKVSFNVLNNNVTATNGTVVSEYEAMSITGQRVSNDTIIPGNVQINTYLGVNEAIFGNKHVYAGTYLQTASGVVKFNDLYNADWRDLSYSGGGLTTKTGSIDGISGLYIQDTTNAYEAIVTTGNLSSIVNALSILPDSTNVDSHMADTTKHFTQSEISITESQISDLQSYLTTETVTSLSIAANILTFTDENGTTTDIDLSLYIDDTNLARITSGTLDGATGIATFSRDDTSTFTIDMSALLDDTTVIVNNTVTSVSTTEALSAAMGNQLDIKIDTKADKTQVLTDVPEGAVFTDTVYDSTNVDSHMDDTTKHFTQSEITITESQISDLQSYLTAHQDISGKADKTQVLTDVPEGAVFTDTVYDKVELGDLTSLTTDIKDTLVDAINEVDTQTDTNTSDISTINNKTLKFVTTDIEVIDDGFGSPTTTYTISGKILTNDNSVVYSDGIKMRKNEDTIYTLTNDGTDTTFSIIDTTKFPISSIIEIETIVNN